jgi:hypothetical protein
VGKMRHHTQATGQGQRTPDPSVSPIVRIIWCAVFLFFLTKLQSSSICTLVRRRFRMK